MITREGESRVCVAAFPAEVQREQSEELGPLDSAGDEQEEVLGVHKSDAEGQEQEFMDQLKLYGVPQFEHDRRREWLAFPERREPALRHLHTNEWSQATSSHEPDHDWGPP